MAVRVRPRASKDAIEGEREGALVVRLQAPPVEGEANAALLRVLVPGPPAELKARLDALSSRPG